MGDFKIVSFNLRCVWENDAGNNFLSRAGGIINRINSEKPDVIGFQEATDQNIAFLKSVLSDYDIFFNQRNSDYTGEGVATAIKRNSFDLLALDFFWLSNTPFVAGSRYAIQSPCPRICQCLLIKRRCDRKMFWVYNNHLDHESDEARILGIKQVLARVAEDNNKISAPLFILGDFNADPDSETIKFCNNYEDVKITDITAESGVSFHNFGGYQNAPLPAAEGEQAGIKIDYIYTDLETAEKVTSITKWTDERRGVFLSDHYPLCAEIAF